MAVHVLIVFLVVTAGDTLHPVFMLEIPCNGLFDAFFEHRLRIPADLFLDLVRSDRVSSVVSCGASVGVGVGSAATTYPTYCPL